MKFRELLTAAGRLKGRSSAGAERANAELVSYRLLTAVADDAPDAILVMNQPGIIQWVSRAFCRLTGYAASEAIANSSRLLECSQHAPEFHALMCRTIVAGLPWQGDVWVRRKDGSELLQRATVTPVTDGSGKIEYFVVVIQNSELNPAAAPGAREEPEEKGLRILVVDDEPMVVAFVKRALMVAGFHIYTAQNGKQALSLLVRQPVDLVIADLVMPNMEGLELIMELRRRSPALPILVISGATSLSCRETALALGARAALAKPFSAVQLLETIREILPANAAG